MNALTWEKKGEDRKGRAIYATTDGQLTVMRGEWKLSYKRWQRNAVGYGGSYRNQRYTMKGWAIYERGRYITRRRTLQDAKDTAEAYSRLGPKGRRALLAL